MDSSFTVRPRPGAPSAYGPRDPVPVREATATDLNAARAVTASSDGGGQQGGQRQQHGKQGEPQPEHHEAVVVDPENRAAIYRERDVRAESREHPDEALMRQRAYGQTAAPQAAAPHDGVPDAKPHADLEA